MAGSRWTPAQRKALAAYVKYILHTLLMPTWEVRLMEEPPHDPEAGAEIKTIYGRRVAELYLGIEFMDHPADRLEHYLLHELCHLVTEDQDSIVRNGLEEIMGKPAFHLFEAHWRWANEQLTDQMAYWLSPLLHRDREYRTVLRGVLTASHGSG